MGIHSIRVKVAIVLVATLALILGLQILYITPTIRKQVVQEATRTQADLASQVTAYLDFAFRQAAAELEAIARLPRLRSMDKFQVDTALEELDQISSFFNYYFVLDLDAVWISYPSRPELVGQTIPAENMEWVSAAMAQNRTVFLDVLVSRVNTLVSGFGTPIRDESGAPVGLLRGVFVVSAPNTVLTTIEQARVGRNGYAYLVAQNGHLLAHPYVPLTVEDFQSQDYMAYEPVARVIRGEAGLVEYEYAGATWIAAYQPLETTGWGLIVHQPKSDVLSLAYSQAMLISIALLFAFGLSTAALLLLVQRAFRPLDRLVADIRAGGVPKGRARRDEIGHLADEFSTLYTELLRSKDELQASEQRYRQLVELAPAGIYELDLTAGRFVSVNDVMCVTTGYSKEELLAMRVDALLTAESQTIFQGRLARTLAGEPVPSTAEYQIVSKNGRVFWVLLNASVRYEQGQPVTATVVVHDISERKRVDLLLNTLNQTALATSQALTPQEIFELVAHELDKLGLFCLIFEPDEAEGRLHVRYVNYDPRVMRVLQRSTGFEVDRFSIPIDRVPIYQAAVVGRETVFVPNALELLAQILPPRTNRLAQRIGRIRAVPQAIMAPLIVRDQVIGVLAVQSSDLRPEDVPAITAFANQVAAAWQKASLMQDLEQSLQELQRTQLQLVQAQKMEAIGRLAGGVAHDFNNILTAIIGYADMILMDMSPEQTAYADIQEIARAAERAAALTHQLLAFSRRQVLQPVILNLNGVVSHVDRMLQRLIGENIQLCLMLDPELGSVRADQAQIEQVVMNLAVNARDAMPYGGQLTIETANVELDEHYAEHHVDVRPGAYVQLAVSDTGVGMDSEVLSHLFEPFFTTKETGQGVGLGLAMVYGIVVQSGGHIYPYSEPGHGTTIKVYLPRVAEQVAALPVAAARAPLPRGDEAILIVEDEDLVRDLAVRVLKQQGYTLLEARRPHQALELCASCGHPIHLLITDVIMPEMGGPDLAVQVAALCAGIKVLYISGYTDNAIVHHGVLDAGLHFMQKPFTPLALARKVREVLDEAEL